MANWYIIIAGKEHGPFTGQQLKEMVTSGKLNESDMIRRDDMSAARFAKTVKGLFPDSATPSATPIVEPQLSSAARFWFVLRDGMEIGPFIGKQLKEMVSKGQVVPDDLLRRGDMKNSIHAKSVKGLFALTQAVSSNSPPLLPVQPIKEFKKLKMWLLCIVGCFLAMVVLGMIVEKPKDGTAVSRKNATKSADTKEAATGIPTPRPEEAKVISQVESQSPALPEFLDSEYQHDYSKDDYAIPAGAKKVMRKRIIKGGAEGLDGKPETEEGYIDSSGKWVEHGTFTTWMDDTETEKFREGKVLHGKLHGMMTCYFPNGQKRWEQLLVQDKMHGIERWWHENGQLASSSPWVQGKYHGRRQGWYDTGALAYIECYVHGDKEGVRKKWWKDGRLALIDCYVKNLRNGKMWSQNEDGSLDEIGEWEFGRPKGKWRIAFTGLDPSKGSLATQKRHRYYIEVNDEPWKGGTIDEFIARMYFFAEKDRPDITTQFDPKMRIAVYIANSSADFFARFGRPRHNMLDFEKAPNGPAFLRDQYRVWSYQCKDGMLTLHTCPSGNPLSGVLMVTAHWRDNPVPGWK